MAATCADDALISVLLNVTMSDSPKFFFEDGNDNEVVARGIIRLRRVGKRALKRFFTFTRLVYNV